MLAHITYLSDEGMHEKFGRRLQDGAMAGPGASASSSRWRATSTTKVARLSNDSMPTAYLYITRAMDYYDAAAAWGGGSLTEACRRIRAKMLIVSFDSDWLYPPMSAKSCLGHDPGNRPVTYANVPSHYGHDSFLVETAKVGRLLRGFLAH